MHYNFQDPLVACNTLEFPPLCGPNAQKCLGLYSRGATRVNAARGRGENAAPSIHLGFEIYSSGCPGISVANFQIPYPANRSD